MPEFVLLLTQEKHIRVLANSLEEAKRYAAHVDTDELSAIDKCDGGFDCTLEVLEDGDPTFGWAAGKSLYRLGGCGIEEDDCVACHHPAVAWWWVAREGEVPRLDDPLACRLCAECLQAAADLPPAETEEQMRERIRTLHARSIFRFFERQAAEQRERDKESG